MKIDSSLWALLPSDNPHLKTFEKLNKLNSQEGSFELLLISKDSSKTIPKAFELAELINQEALEVGIQNVEVENDLYKVKPHIPYLLTNRELNRILYWAQNYKQLQNKKANPFLVSLEEDSKTEDSTSVEQLFESIESKSIVVEQILNHRRYDISEDGTQVRIHVFPSFTKSDFRSTEFLYEYLQSIKEQFVNQQKNVNVLIGGDYLRQYYKIADVQKALQFALFIGVVCLLFFLGAFLRFKFLHLNILEIARDVVLIFLILLSAFSISLGVISLFQDTLLIFTLIAFGILFGLNLDYVLHIYAELQKGHEIRFGAQIRTYFKPFKAILISAVTTAIAVLSLAFSNFKGFGQLGTVFFLTILINLVGSFAFLPVLRNKKTLHRSHHALNEKTSWLLEKQWMRIFFTFLSLGIVVFGLVSPFVYSEAFTPSLNVNFSSLEPKLRPNPFADVKLMPSSQLSSRNDPAYFYVENRDQLKSLYHQLSGGISVKSDGMGYSSIESVAYRIPQDSLEINEKAALIAQIKEEILGYEEVLSDFKLVGVPLPILLDSAKVPSNKDMPDFIRNRFFTHEGKPANLLLVYPNQSLSSGGASVAFREKFGSIQLENGLKVYAASTFIIASSVLENLLDARDKLILYPILCVSFLMLLFYRKLIQWLYILFPAVLALLLLFALMHLFGFTFNVYNLIVVPIFLGVATDNSLHLEHSIQLHGIHFLNPFIQEKLPILAACSFSSVLGFIGLLFIDHPGLESLGWLAILAMIVDLIALLAVAFLISLLRLRLVK